MGAKPVLRVQGVNEAEIRHDFWSKLQSTCNTAKSTSAKRGLACLP
jgi:hypothetical protein